MIPRWASALAVVVAVAAAGCGGDDEPDGPSATVESTPRATTTTTARTPEEEVEAAYLRSWDVYAEAVRKLDASRLPESYADEALKTVEQEVARLAGNNTPVRVRVDHRYEIRLVQDDRAVVVDRYVNHSVYVDPSSGEPTESDPNEQIVETYTLLMIESTWRVVSIVRQ